MAACLLQANCLVLLFAAHDTVASCMALLLRFLKHNPEALQKLRAEQRQVSHQGTTPCFCLAMTKVALASVWSTMPTKWLVLLVTYTCDSMPCCLVGVLWVTCVALLWTVNVLIDWLSICLLLYCLLTALHFLPAGQNLGLL